MSILGVGVDVGGDIAGWILAIMVLTSPIALAQSNDQAATATESKPPVWITLKSGEVYTGILIRMDNNTIEFKVNDVIQSKPMSEVIQIRFSDAPPPSPALESTVRLIAPAVNAEPVPSDQKTRPSISLGPLVNRKLTITYQEKAKYTDEARKNEVQGTVVLDVMFSYDGSITSIQVVRGLPNGLTESAIEAAQKIKFEPAIKNGEPVSTRGNLEFSFNLNVVLPPPSLTSPKDEELINNVLRRAVLQWEPVPGARRYKVRIEKEGKRRGHWTLDHETEVTANYYELEFPGADAWRWKVEAINAVDRDGRWSEWRTLRLLKKIE